MAYLSVQAPVAGFRFTNGFALLNADRMHIDSGIFGHLWNFLKRKVAMRHIRKVDAYIHTCPKHALLGRVADMAQTGHINPSEAVGAFAKLLPVAILLLHGEGLAIADVLLDLFTGGLLASFPPPA